MAAATGQALANLTVPATPDGYRQLLELADQHHGQRVWAIEGTGGYGAGLTRSLAAHTEQVVELDRPRRATRRHGAKSDPLDAVRAAREVLAVSSSPSPERPAHEPPCRCGWLPAARRSRPPAMPNASCTRWASPPPSPTRTPSRLLDPPAGGYLRPAAGSHRLGCGDSKHYGPTLRSLAHRIRELTAEAADHRQAILELVRAWRPDLLARPGVGPIVAATVLCAWSHAGRCRTDAAFAMLGGAAPIPASLARPSGFDSTAPETASSTRPCTPWS